MSLIWDFIQQSQINRLQREHGKRDSRTHEVLSDSRSLKERQERLCLVCEAMWEILKDSLAVSESMLLDKVQEIDLRDGTLDGKHNKCKKCNACGRLINPQREKCLFCGNKDIIESAWEKV